MRLCMFHPVGHPMERGWVGRLDGDRVIHLAAQTLQSFFTGGGSAREHAEYPRAEVRLLAPVLHPPSIRVFGDDATFAFANPAAIQGPGAEISAGEGRGGVRPHGPDPERSEGRGRVRPVGSDPRRSADGRGVRPHGSDPGRGAHLALAPRIAGLIGADGALAAFTILAEWRDPTGRPPKDRDFALGLGPAAATADAFDPGACVQVVRVDGVERVRKQALPFDWEAAVSLAVEGTRLYPGDLLAGPSCGLVDGIASGAVVEVEVDGIGVLEQRLAS